MLTEQQIINPTRPIHFQAANRLGQLRPDRAAGVLNDIASGNIGRASILLVDIRERFGRRAVNNIMNSMPSQVKRSAIEFISNMPTFDAAKFRKDVLKMPADEAYALSHHAWQNIYPLADYNHSRLHAYYSGFSEQDIRSIISAADASHQAFAPLFFDADASDTNISEFYRWAGALFPADSYGYHSIWEKMTLAGGTSQFEVRLPKGPGFDGTGVQFHQCCHTAIAARSFFSQLGMPSEVLHFMLPSKFTHNAAVIFSPGIIGIKTTLVDASPFARAFSEQQMANVVPMSWNLIRSDTNDTHCFAKQIYIDDMGGNSLPWFSHQLGHGTNLIGFVHVVVRYDRSIASKADNEGYTSLLPELEIILTSPDRRFTNFGLPILRGNGDEISFLWSGIQRARLGATMIDAIEAASLEPARHFIQMLQGFKIIR
ncbi:MAG: hypothetical protein WC527_05645 [Candidatus Margulisiibacteriota bacterium]